MGASMPLPGRIPVPPAELRAKMQAAGFAFGRETSEGGCKLIVYDLPKGWTFVDETHQTEHPDWSFVDATSMRRFQVRGVWKMRYDNVLSIEEISVPTKYVAEREENRETNIAGAMMRHGAQNWTGTAEEADAQQWAQLVYEWNAVVDSTSGCGDQAQHYVDAAHQKMVEFTNSHPNFIRLLPAKRHYL
jgi:hypothetical protein